MLFFRCSSFVFFFVGEWGEAYSALKSWLIINSSKEQDESKGKLVMEDKDLGQVVAARALGWCKMVRNTI
jgi:hypothetical protein